MVALHSFVGQEGGPGGQLFIEAEPDRLHGSVFRGYKMDRSSITGAVASLEEHLETDHEKIFREARVKAVLMASEFEEVEGVKTRLYDTGEVAEEPGRISLHLVLERSPDEIEEVVRELMQGEPPIWTSREGHDLVVNITSFMGLMLAEEGDTKTIITRVKDALG